MINHLNYKLNLIETNLELKSSLELQLTLVDLQEHLSDVWEELSPDEELRLTSRISKIEEYIKSLS